MTKPVLGRGLDALFAQTQATQRQGQGQNDQRQMTQHDERERIEQIDLNSIFPNRLQPRRTFSEESLKELAYSLKREGILQPLLVIQEENGFMLVAGERRWRAARIAGLTAAPARILPRMEDAKLLQLALIENLQREDLNPIETAQAYKDLLERYNMTQQELSDQIGKSRSAIANSIRLLALPVRILEYIASGKLSEGHARSLLSVNDPNEQVRLAESAMHDSLTVRHIEDATRHSRKRRLIPKHRDIDILAAENNLKMALQAPVKIKTGLKRGKIEIEYRGVDDLNRLLELLQSVRVS